MTKDNWIKAFDEQFSFIGGCIDRDTLANYLTIKKYGTEHLQDIKAFISQVEKDAINRLNHDHEILVNTILETKNKEIEDAIEKTNKRWREKIGGLKDECEFMESDAHDICQHCGKWKDEHFKQPGFNQALSTLLEDKT